MCPCWNICKTARACQVQTCGRCACAMMWQTTLSRLCHMCLLMILYACLLTCATHIVVLQAATSIANAASHNAHDERYSSPYAKEALKQGMDIPWWEKVLGTRMKDGRPQLAKLQVCKLLMRLTNRAFVLFVCVISSALHSQSKIPWQHDRVAILAVASNRLALCWPKQYDKQPQIMTLWVSKELRQIEAS